MATKTELLNKEYENALFLNSRGNYVHVKLIEKFIYKRGQRKFDMCEARTKIEAIAKSQGSWMFTADIKSAIRKGTLKLV